MYCTCVSALSSQLDKNELMSFSSSCCFLLWGSVCSSCRGQYHCRRLRWNSNSTSLWPLAFRSTYQATIFTNWLNLTPLSRSHNCQFTLLTDRCGKRKYRTLIKYSNYLIDMGIQYTITWTIGVCRFNISGNHRRGPLEEDDIDKLSNNNSAAIWKYYILRCLRFFWQYHRLIKVAATSIVYVRDRQVTST